MRNSGLRSDFLAAVSTNSARRSPPFARWWSGSLADWDLVRLNVEANNPYVLLIDRGGQHADPR